MCFFGGNPPSSPARSNPTTPRSRKSTASFAHVGEHLVRHALEGLGRLHDAGGMREPFEEERQAAAAGAALKPGGELSGVGRREIVLLIARQLHNRLRPQAAVEVIVQQHFRQEADGRVVERHASASPSIAALAAGQAPGAFHMRERSLTS